MPRVIDLTRSYWEKHKSCDGLAGAVQAHLLAVVDYTISVNPIGVPDAAAERPLSFNAISPVAGNSLSSRINAAGKEGIRVVGINPRCGVLA